MVTVFSIIQFRLSQPWFCLIKKIRKLTILPSQLLHKEFLCKLPKKKLNAFQESFGILSLLGIVFGWFLSFLLFRVASRAFMHYIGLKYIPKELS